MSKKNSNVILKKFFEEFPNISKIYSDFKKKLDLIKSKNFLVAISGGPDSLALTALSKAYSHETKRKVYYVLINHNIRKNSSNEAHKVKTLLKKYKINLKVICNKQKIERNIQSQARKIRYDYLKKYCLEKKIQTVLTAHNLEDQVETFFIRLSRGSGLTGLSSIQPLTKLNDKVKLYRPLLDIEKKYLIFTAKKIFGKFFVDPSNNNRKYLRTKIRNLKKTLNQSGIKYNQIIKSINNLASSKATLDEYFERIFNEVTNRSQATFNIRLDKFSKMNKEIKMRIINESIKKIKKNYYNPRSKKVLNLIKNLDSKDFRGATLGGCKFFIKKGKLCLKLEKNN